MSDCENLFIDSDGDGEADTMVRVCNGEVVGSINDKTPSVGVKSSTVDKNPEPPWVEPLIFIVLIALGFYSFRFRQRKKGFKRMSAPAHEAGNMAQTTSPRVANKQSNDLARARGTPQISEDNNALICSVCGSHHGLRSDWRVAVINCDCGVLIDVCSGDMSISNQSNAQTSSTDLLYDVWVTGIGSFKIADESVLEIEKCIDQAQRHLLFDSLKHNLKQLKKKTRTEVLISTKIPDDQAQESRLRLEELGLVAKVERNYAK